MTASWMSLLWFALIVALIPAALWLVKRSGMGGALARSQGLGLRQVGSIGVGPQQRVVAVEVGEGEARRWLLLGVTPQQINTLHVLDRWPGTMSLEGTSGGAAMPAGGFASELTQRLRAGWAGAAANAGSARKPVSPDAPGGDHHGG